MRKQKAILLRLDLNVPLNHRTGEVLETTKIDTYLREIKKLSQKNKVIILSHLGKGDRVKDRLKPVADYLRQRLSKTQNQNLEVLENVRFWKGETEKEDSKIFRDLSKYFAELGEEYINDAFASLHRSHASIVGIPKVLRERFKTKKEFQKKVRLGPLVNFEIKNLNRILREMKKKSALLILSGSKISTKLPLILRFLEDRLKVFVSGAIANQILKDVLGYNIGLSWYEEDFQMSEKDRQFLKESIAKGCLILPKDVLLKDQQEKRVNSLHLRDRIVDLARTSLKNLKEEILKAKVVILNGPLGLYEEGFTVGTVEILEFLKWKAGTNKDFFVCFGGGDTLALLEKVKIKSGKNIFLSTGGGAMLEYLAKNGDLPGIKAIKK